MISGKPKFSFSSKPEQSVEPVAASGKVEKVDKKKEIRQQLFAMIKDDKTKALFYKSCAMIMVSKGLAIASPWFLKSVVDTMALGTNVCLNTAFLGIGAFGASRLISTILQEERML